VWAGFADGQIGLNNRARLQTYSVQGGGNLGGVLTLYESGAHIWAGGSNGLAVLDASGFHRLRAVEGAALRGISGIVKSLNQDVWLNAASGIVRLPAGEVQRALGDFNYKMQAEIFDFRDGIAGSPAQLRPTPTAVADSTGRLWFATAGHVVSVDPAAVARQRALPHIVIESIVSDGVRQAVPGSGAVEIRARNLQIDYVGISLASPQRVTYRYKLDGEDTEWQEAGARRQAFYTSLAPGRYRFHVAAAIGDGRWTELELPGDVVVPPAFYQTTWFMVASAIALITVLGIGHEFRVQQITQQVRDRLKQRAAERAQISRDLHDTLLQGIHGLMLRFHFVAQQIPEGAPERRVMEEALTTADKVIEEGRDRVRSLRAEALSKEDLANRLAQVGTALNWDHSVQFSVATEGSSPALHPIVEDELFMIGREAVTNSFRHAGASRIDVEINSDGDAIRLRCVDNGQGIGAEILSTPEANNHFGHLGMRERAEKIGATLKCRSAPGQGTEITVTVPGRLGGRSDKLFRLVTWPLLKRWLGRDTQGLPRV
jgi:signal transduction histidine kinase